MISKLFSILIFVCLVQFDVSAKLATSDFEALVYESRFILKATVVESNTNSAVLAVTDVYKGEFNEHMVNITMTKEVHEQVIEKIGADYILFLKRLENGELTGTHYGRSYWVIDYGNAGKSASGHVHFVYPITKIAVKKESAFLIAKIPNTSTEKPTERWIDLSKLIPNIIPISERYERKINDIERIKDKYNQLDEQKKQVFYPFCPDYMFSYSERNGLSRTEICSGFWDQDIQIQNGWTARFKDGSSHSNQIIHLKAGKRHGPIKVVHGDGDWWEGIYSEGELNGQRTYWYSNGNKYQEGTFSQGQLDGEFLTWYLDGTLKERSFYVSDRKVSSRCWDEKGVKKNDADC